MLRCTGVATSTFGGGGGTKVFCSQPLKLAKMASRNPIRNSGATTERRPSSNPQQADERASFIPVHQFNLPRKEAFIRRSLSRAFHSNNWLAVEPETENDTARQNCCTRLFQERTFARTTFAGMKSAEAPASVDNK